MYIQRVERDESGQVIIIKRKALDTDRVLMCGDNQDDEGNIIRFYDKSSDSNSKRHKKQAENRKKK